MIFVPATPGSQLKHRYMKEIKETGFKVKVIEQSGVTLKRMLQRSPPFRKKQCRSIDCLICKTGGKRSCRSTGVTYELICSEFVMNITGTFNNDAMLRQITERS